MNRFGVAEPAKPAKLNRAMNDQNPDSPGSEAPLQNAEPAQGQSDKIPKKAAEFLTPSLNAEQKEFLKALILRLAEQGTPPAEKDRIEQLQRSVWWWRHFEKGSDTENFYTPRSDGKAPMKIFGVEPEYIEWLEPMMLRTQRYPAFVYEIAVRLMAPDLIPISWLKLPYEIKGPLIDAFEPCDPLHGVVSVLQAADRPIDSHWTESVDNLSFNLLHNNRTLADYFLELFIEPERRRLGVPAPKPNEGKRNRPFSWNPIEFLDMQRLNIKVLTDSERGHLSKARREVESALDLPRFKDPRGRSLRNTSK